VSNGKDTETVAEIKRLRERVKMLEEKAANTDNLKAQIEELQGKIEKSSDPDFVDWDEPVKEE